MLSKKPGFWMADARSPLFWRKKTGFLHISSYLWDAIEETRFLGSEGAIAIIGEMSPLIFIL
ncbi:MULTISPECIES: hypothetical protein [Planktothricoides]|uniref:Uncharacterized protein n=1 Tax=Planktothricoides raciborskii GIHE-MW2 TaxID=2792601 RepID=A0AAU8JDV4_9CYAN|nr:hypothetical protein [Planktothricoides sp. SR001]